MTVEEISKVALRKVADFLFTNSQENIITMGISDLGFLLGSGEIKEEGENIIISYDAPYASAINFGTDPHFVSPKELEGWVRRKLNKKSEKEVKKVAFLISRKIAKLGTQPKPFFDKAVAATRIKFKP